MCGIPSRNLKEHHGTIWMREQQARLGVLFSPSKVYITIIVSHQKESGKLPALFLSLLWWACRQLSHAAFSSHYTGHLFSVMHEMGGTSFSQLYKWSSVSFDWRYHTFSLVFADASKGGVYLFD
jgi:hypothetical protein